MPNESNTVSMNVSLPEALKKYVDDQVRSGTYSSASEFVRDLIRKKVRRDQERAAANSHLIETIREGIESGPAVPVDKDYWPTRKAAFKARHQQANKP